MAKSTEADNVKRLFTSTKDWLKTLPPPDVAYDEVWREKPVDIETWFSSPLYMGLGKIKLSQIQKDALSAMDDINPETNEHQEFVMEWGKGSGKDFICALAELRQVYLLHCLRDPYEYYGLAKNTGIQLINVAYTKDQAKGPFLGQLKGLLRGSRWFAKHEWTINRDRVIFPEFAITLISGAADGDSLEGNNVFFAVMDEASAFKDSNAVKSMNKSDGGKVEHAADAVYNVLRTSANSRFPSIGKVAIISYPRFRGDFTQQKRAENESAARGWTSGPYCTWEVNPRVKKEDFAEDYAQRPEMAEAMYECKPPFASDGYVRYPERFIHAAAMGKALGIENPIKNDQYALDFRGIPGKYYAIHVDLALNRDKCALALGRQGEPVKRFKCPCNSFNFKDVDRCKTCGRIREQWNESLLPTCVITLLKQFKPHEAKGDVDFSDVRDEILWMRDRGHKIWALSYDGWQSVDSRQIMAGILGKRKVRDRWGKSEREEEIVSMLSVDRNTEAHDTLKEFIYDERLFIYAPEFDAIELRLALEEAWNESDDVICQAFREWRTLRLLNGKKVDHPIGGSKDLVDALAGVALHVSRMPITANRGPSLVGFREAGR